jgi:large subunit ribosomal protein L21
MYAVIETGAKQYRVEVGTELEVELLDVEPGQSITLERVLLVVDGAAATVGTPIVVGAAVEAEVVGQTRGDKVIAFKYRPKARRRVKKGHRQDLTVLRIADIRFNGKSAAAGVEKPANSKADERRKIEETAARQAAEDAALAAKLAVASPAEATSAPKRVKAAPPEATETVEATTPVVAEPAEVVAEVAEAKASRAFEIIEDKAGQWRWRLRARNGELVAMSEQGFTTKAGVVRSLDVVRRNTAAAEGYEEILPAEDGGETKTAKGFEIYEDKSGHWRWRLRAGNGELLAVPEQGFSSKAGVVRALDVVRRNVAEAGAHEEAGTAESSTAESSITEAPPKRTRAKKDE